MHRLGSFLSVAAAWWTGTEVPSIITTSPLCASTTASVIRSHMLARVQRTKRLNAVMLGP